MGVIRHGGSDISNPCRTRHTGQRCERRWSRRFHPPRFGGGARRISEFVELFRFDRRGCVHQQVLAALGLRKCDHVAQVVDVSQHHDPPIQPIRKTSVGWCARVEGVEQEAKPRLGRLFRISDDLEDAPLDVRAVIAQAARAELDTIDDNVVVRPTHLLGRRCEQRNVLFDRCDEGLVDVGEPTVIVSLKDRKVDDEEHVPGSIVHPPELAPEIRAEAGEHPVGAVRLVGLEKKQ